MKIFSNLYFTLVLLIALLISTSAHAFSPMGTGNRHADRAQRARRHAQHHSVTRRKAYHTKPHAHHSAPIKARLREEDLTPSSKWFDENLEDRD